MKSIQLFVFPTGMQGTSDDRRPWQYHHINFPLCSKIVFHRASVGDERDKPLVWYIPLSFISIEVHWRNEELIRWVTRLFQSMENNRLRTSAALHQLFERFSERLERRHFFCLQNSQPSQIKLQRIESYCQQHGFIFNRSTINMIRNSLSTMMTSAFDSAIEQKSAAVPLQKHIDIQLQLTHVNALPSRTERGIFLIIELGNQNEDVRYSLVTLLGKQIPSYEILHSRGYDLPESIRKSHGTVLLDQLAIGLKDFWNEVSEHSERTSSIC